MLFCSFTMLRFVPSCRSCIFFSLNYIVHRLDSGIVQPPWKIFHSNSRSLSLLSHIFSNTRETSNPSEANRVQLKIFQESFEQNDRYYSVILLDSERIKKNLRSTMPHEDKLDNARNQLRVRVKNKEEEEEKKITRRQTREICKLQRRIDRSLVRYRWNSRFLFFLSRCDGCL